MSLPPHEMVQFERTLAAAVERLCERSIQRCGGQAEALAQLKTDPEGQGVWLSRFIKSFLEEELLNTPAGSAFILLALQRRPAPAVEASNIGKTLEALAETAFAVLVREKAVELLERESMYSA